MALVRMLSGRKSKKYERSDFIMAKVLKLAYDYHRMAREINPSQAFTLPHNIQLAHDAMVDISNAHKKFTATPAGRQPLLSGSSHAIVAREEIALKMIPIWCVSQCPWTIFWMKAFSCITA